MDWDDFIEIRSFTARRRSFLTMDEAFLSNGKDGKFTLTSWVDATFGSLDGLLMRLTLMGQGPCSGFVAIYLPMTQADLMLRIDQGKLSELRLYRTYDAPECIGTDHEALREIGPATHTRAAHASLPGGLVKADPARVEKVLTEALQMWPGYPPALVTRGKLAKLRGDAGAALRAFEEAASEDFPLAFFHIGDVLDEIDQNQEALSAYDRAVALGLRTADLFSQRATALRRLNRSEDGWASNLEALKVDPHHTASLVNMAWLSFQAGNRDAAIAAAQELRPAKLAGPSRETTLHVLSELGMRTETNKEWMIGARCFELMVDIDPSDAKSWFNWGAALTNMGAHNDAAAKLRMAIKLDPNYEKAKMTLDNVEKQVAAGFPEGTIAVRSRHTIRYVNSRGAEKTIRNFVVKAETTHRWIETEVNRLSLDNDKDLLKLLIAKGHNAAISTSTPKQQGLMARLIGKPQPAPPVATHGRPITFIVTQKPSPDFIEFAQAIVWHTARGKRINSAPVEICLDERGGPQVTLTRPERNAEFHLQHECTFENQPSYETEFYPETYSDNEDQTPSKKIRPS